jgi:hypothetical protein
MSSWPSPGIVDRAHPVIGATVISPAVLATSNIGALGV